MKGQEHSNFVEGGQRQPPAGGFQPGHIPVGSEEANCTVLSSVRLHALEALHSIVEDLRT